MTLFEALFLLGYINAELDEIEKSQSSDLTENLKSDIMIVWGENEVHY